MTNDDESAMWQSATKAFAHQFGLYLPQNTAAGTVQFQSWRKVFADDLWPARKKWQQHTTNQAHTDHARFKIQVSVRFRPTEQKETKEKLSLPLHQLIRLKRQGMKKNKGKSAMIRFGGKRNPPSRLLDAMTSRLMKEPRRLPSSKKVMDLHVLIKCIERDPSDPFDGTPLEITQLLKCPALDQELAVFHSSNNEGEDGGSTGTLNQVSMGAIQKLAASGQSLSPEVLEMLMEAETLMEQTSNAEKAALRPSNTRVLDRGHDHDTRRTIAPTINTAATINSTATTNTTTAATTNNEENMVPESDAFPINPNLQPPPQHNTTQPPWKRSLKKKKHAETPKLLGVQNSRINFFVPGTGIRNFLFPRCFDGNSTQSQIYSECARSAVFAALNGMSSAVLSYGQTGSGKTFTQFGPPDWESQLEKDLKCNATCSLSSEQVLSTCGCVIRGIVDVLKCIEDNQQTQQSNGQITCSATYTQIYQNKCSCLLSNNACQVRRDTGAITGCSQYPIENIDDALHVLHVGEQNKQFAATAMNDRSSRAHTIFTLHLAQSKNDALIQSKLYFVDLAGSEKIKQSKVSGKALHQAIGINQSLHVLGKVIQNLVKGKSHVPYLESRLTTLLKGCFGGDCLTRVLVSCRSNNDYSEESLNSLRFGERCARITNSVQRGLQSLESALSIIDSSIDQCERGLQSLAARGKDTTVLQERKDLLVLKRKDLARLGTRQ